MNRHTLITVGLFGLFAILFTPSASAQLMLKPPTAPIATPPEPIAPPPADAPASTDNASAAVDKLIEETMGGVPLPGGEPGPQPEPVSMYEWYQPAYWFGPAPWDSGVELGINGSGGTSNTLSMRTGGFIKRKTDFHKVDLSLYYNHNKADGNLTQSNALLDARYDWLWPDSRWSPYVMSQTFYDQFQAFDFNFNINAGLGYQLIKKDWVDLTVRSGAGVSRKFGGTPDEWVPEAQFGFSYNQQLSKGQKFYAKSDYFPAWEDFGQYRVLSEMGLEVELNQPSNMSLKLGVTDRYDSVPNGVSPHNTNYSALLIWKL